MMTITQPAPVKAAKVLIVEDNPDAAAAFRAVLQFRGHEVSVANSGPQGLAMAREKHPRVIVCDLGLPGMDGIEVVRTLRADPAMRDVRICALTAQSDDAIRAQAAAVGFDRFIEKPPHFVDIIAFVEGVDVAFHAS